MGIANFDNYTLGTIVGQVWEGGTTGTGIWSSHVTGGYTQPDPLIIADPTGAGRGQVLKLEALGENASYGQDAVFTPSADLYPTNHIITIAWDQWRPDLGSSVRIQEGIGGLNVPAFTAYEYGLGDGSLYPTGSPIDYGVQLNIGTWEHVILIIDIEHASISCSVDGVVPNWGGEDFNPQDFSLGSNGLQCLSICFRQFSTNFTGEGVDYVLIDNLAITGVEPAGSIILPEIKRQHIEDGTYDGGRREWEVRAYRLQGTDGWKRLFIPSRSVISCDYAFINNGGMAECTVSFPRDMYNAGISPIDGHTQPDWDLTHLIDGDRISVWVKQNGIWYEWYRGYYRQGEEATGSPSTVNLTAFGLLNFMKGIYVKKRYVGPSEDISELFGRLIGDFLDPRRAAVGLPPLERSLEAVGAFTSTQDYDGFLDEILSQVASSVAGVTWGVDIFPSGQEGIYLRNIPTEVLYNVMLGKDASSFEHGYDSGDVINTVKIIGGAAEHPNLVPNGGFEKPTGESANFISNPSFEDARSGDPQYPANWTRISGTASRKESYKENLGAHSGSWYLEIDNYHAGRETIGSNYSPTLVPVAGANSYELALWTAIENQNAPVSMSVWIDTFTEAGVLIDHLYVAGLATDQPYTLPAVADRRNWSPITQEWVQRRFQFNYDPGVNFSMRVFLSLDHGGGENMGFGVDDVQLFSRSTIAQENWIVTSSSPGTPLTQFYMTWDNDDDPPPEGYYYVSIKDINTMGGGLITLRQEQNFKTTLNSQMLCQFWCRGATGMVVKVRARKFKGGDADGVNEGTIALTATWAQYFLYFTSSSEGDEARIEFEVQPSQIGQFDVDAVYVHVGQLEYPFDSGEPNAQFFRSTDDTFIQGDSTISQEVKDSITFKIGPNTGLANHGKREGVLTDSRVKTATDADYLSKSFFTQNAVARSPEPVTVFDRLRRFRSDGLLRVSNLPHGVVKPALFVIRAGHTFNTQGWMCKLDLSNEKAGIVQLLQQIGQVVVQKFNAVLSYRK